MRTKQPPHIRRATEVALVCLLIALSPASSLAQETNALERGRELFRSFEYDDALELMQRVAADPDVSAGQRIGALELAGVIHLLQRREDDARESFQRLLSFDPGHELNDTELPPRVQQFFDQVRGESQPSNQLEVQLRAPETFPEAGAAPVTLELSGETAGVAESVLHTRLPDAAEFSEAAMTRDGASFTAELEPFGEGVLEFYITVQAPSGHVLATVGSDESPQRIASPPPVAEPVEPIEAPSRRAWYRTWWFWTVVGVVVAGGVTAGVIAGTRPEEHENGTLGSVRMPLVGPSPY